MPYFGVAHSTFLAPPALLAARQGGIGELLRWWHCREEEGALGGIIVQDSLDLLCHLLQSNVGNQLMFR